MELANILNYACLWGFVWMNTWKIGDVDSESASRTEAVRNAWYLNKQELENRIRLLEERLARL